MSLLNRELPLIRRLLIRVFLFFSFFSLLGLFFSKKLEKLTVIPLCKAYKELCERGGLITLGIFGPLNTVLYLSFLLSIFFTIPYLLIEVFFYTRSSLRAKEKNILTYTMVILFQVYAIALFFAYKLLPTVLSFFQLDRYSDVYSPMITYIGYIKFLIYYILLVCIYAISPIILFFCVVSGFLKFKIIKKFWRIALFISFLIACALIPSNDIVTLALVSLPVFGMYCFILFFAFFYEKYSKKKAKQKTKKEM